MSLRHHLIFTAIATIMSVCFSLGASAQNVDDDSYRFDAGVNLGMSGYLGDANSSLFKHAGFGGQLSMRYMPNSRMAFRAVLQAASLSGNTADTDNALPEGAVYDFKATNYDLSVRYEFNFFPYGIGETYKKLRRWSPYLVAGLGVNLATCDGNTAIAPSIPLGLGVKFKLRQRWNLMAEFTMAKVFGDHVDGKKLSDLTGIKSSFLKNTDWVSMISIGISYEFSRRCSTCHYVD